MEIHGNSGKFTSKQTTSHAADTTTIRLLAGPQTSHHLQAHLLHPQLILYFFFWLESSSTGERTNFRVFQLIFAHSSCMLLGHIRFFAAGIQPPVEPNRNLGWTILHRTPTSYSILFSKSHLLLVVQLKAAHFKEEEEGITTLT